MAVCGSARSSHPYLYAGSSDAAGEGGRRPRGAGALLRQPGRCAKAGAGPAAAWLRLSASPLRSEASVLRDPIPRAHFIALLAHLPQALTLYLGQPSPAALPFPTRGLCW